MLPQVMATASGRMGMDQLAGPMIANLRREGTRLFDESGAAELDKARASGIVKISAAVNSRAIANALASSHTNGSRQDTDRIYLLLEWIGRLGRLLTDPRKRLLFDDEAGSIAAGLIDQGMVEPNPLVIRHAREAAVGSGLIARLPAFPQAPLDELLDLRSDLSGPLTRYRRAASTMATSLSARPFDRDAAAEIDDLWNHEVAPALNDIA